MLDVPNPFQYYRVDLGLAMVISMLLLVVSGNWYLLTWVFSIAMVGLVFFGFFVSAMTARTLLYGPAIFLISCVRILFVILYSIRFFGEHVKRLVWR